MLEAIQYKKQFIPDYDVIFKKKSKAHFADNSVGWIIRLPTGLPSSSIIERDNDYIAQIIALYDKYISNDADLCINISYDARQKFISEMNEIVAQKNQTRENETENNTTESNDEYNETTSKMLTIFDGALLDIDANLSSSFVRLQLYGNIDAKQDIIDVMMEQTK